MTWGEQLAVKAAMINIALDQYLPPATSYPPVIHQAMRYSVFAGGKRLRGALALATAELCGRSQELILPLAAALEMIHTYSLIHDDLPAMDDDDFRRGKPTCHKVYGEGVAILAGDALLTYAFQTLVGISLQEFGAEAVLQVVSEIAAAAGCDGLIGGQVVDLESEGKEILPATLDYIHSHKTGALFRVAIRSGALIGGYCTEILDALTGYAESFGLAFQITDDILDLTGNMAMLGKGVQRDLALGKATYPALFGMERACTMAAEQVDAAVAYLQPFGEKADFLRDAALYLLHRDS